MPHFAIKIYCQYDRALPFYLKLRSSLFSTIQIYVYICRKWMDKRCDVNCAPPHAFVDKYMGREGNSNRGKESVRMGAKNGKIE